MDEPNIKHRYWVFYIEEFYPAGGLSDIVFTSDELFEAKKYTNEHYYGMAYIFDSVNKEYID